MKKIITCFVYLYVLLSAYSANAHESLRYAEGLYEQQKFDSALIVYNQLVAEGYESADLYYNIGNIYYKKMDIAHAILFYERAYLLDPNDSDIEYNLAFAHSQQTDKIDVIGEGVFQKMYKSLYRFFSLKMWIFLSVFCFFLFLIGLLIFLFSRVILYKKIGFFLGIFCVLFSGISYSAASSRYSELTNREYAIIMEPTVSIRTEPTYSSKVLVVLHGGVKLTILQERNGWYSIRLQDGKQGWIEQEYVERI